MKYLLLILFPLLVLANDFDDGVPTRTDNDPHGSTQVKIVDETDPNALGAKAKVTDNKLHVFVADVGDGATEATLLAFKSEAHQDSLDIQTILNEIDASIDAFKDEAHGDSIDEQTILNTIESNTNEIEGLITDTNTKLDTANSFLESIDQTGAKDSTITTFQGEAHADSIDEQGFLIQIRDYVDTVETLLGISNTQLTAINSNTDNIESLITASNVQLTAINANTDNIETLITASNVQLTAINGNTDGLEALLGITNTRIGDLTETAPGTDTASSGLNGRLQRIAQNITSNGTKIDTTNTSIGATNETAAASDTATSGINGLFKRLLQRFTTLISASTTYFNLANQGKTIPYAGTTATGADFSLPSVAGNQIQRFIIECRNGSTGNATLGISFDGGTTFFYIDEGVSFIWEPKKNAGGSNITQLVLRPSGSGLIYQAVVNYEP